MSLTIRPKCMAPSMQTVQSTHLQPHSAHRLLYLIAVNQLDLGSDWHISIFAHLVLENVTPDAASSYSSLRYGRCCGGLGRDISHIPEEKFGLNHSGRQAFTSSSSTGTSSSPSRELSLCGCCRCCGEGWLRGGCLYQFAGQQQQQQQ